METIKFETPKDLLQFYLDQGYFAMYYCANEASGLDISHFVLIRSGDRIGPECVNGEIYDLRDRYAFELVQHFLQTGQVVIHPHDFSILKTKK